MTNGISKYSNDANVESGSILAWIHDSNSSPPFPTLPGMMLKSIAGGGGGYVPYLLGTTLIWPQPCLGENCTINGRLFCQYHISDFPRFYIIANGPDIQETHVQFLCVSNGRRPDPEKYRVLVSLLVSEQVF